MVPQSGATTDEPLLISKALSALPSADEAKTSWPEVLTCHSQPFCPAAPPEVPNWLSSVVALAGTSVELTQASMVKVLEKLRLAESVILT